MGADWLNSLLVAINNAALVAAFFLILLNWRLPILRALALVNFCVGFAGIVLMLNVSKLPLQDVRYFWYLATASVNFSKALLILALIGWRFEYLCKTSMQLLTLFTLLGSINIARFIDRFFLGGGASDGLFAASYPIIIPTLNWLALFALAYPYCSCFFVRKPD